MWLILLPFERVPPGGLPRIPHSVCPLFPFLLFEGNGLGAGGSEHRGNGEAAAAIGPEALESVAALRVLFCHAFPNRSPHSKPAAVTLPAGGGRLNHRAAGLRISG